MTAKLAIRFRGFFEGGVKMAFSGLFQRALCNDKKRSEKM